MSSESYPARTEQAEVRTFGLTTLPGELGIVRLDPGEDVPAWAGGTFSSVTRTPEELSIVCDHSRIPQQLQPAERWRCMRVRGTFTFDVIGVLSSLSRTLADAEVSLLAIATFDTDYLLVESDSYPRATAALAAAGHSVD